MTGEGAEREGGLVQARSGTVLVPGVGQVVVPAVIAGSGDDIANRFVEFFVVAIRNVNTRRSYATAVRQFCAWLEQHGVPVHHQLVGYLETYLDAAGIRDRRATPLFRSTRSKTGLLTERALDPVNAWAMVKRRLRQAGVPDSLCNHSFRAMGMTAYIENGGNLEGAQDLANHADARTTRLYIRNERQITQSAVEQIRF